MGVALHVPFIRLLGSHDFLVSHIAMTLSSGEIGVARAGNIPDGLLRDGNSAGQKNTTYDSSLNTGFDHSSDSIADSRSRAIEIFSLVL